MVANEIHKEMMSVPGFSLKNDILQIKIEKKKTLAWRVSLDETIPRRLILQDYMYYTFFSPEEPLAHPDS